MNLMSAHPKLVEMIEGGVRVQRLLFAFVGWSSIVTGALIDVAVLATSPKPGDESARPIMVVVGLVMVAAGAGFLVYVKRRVARLRALVLDSPTEIETVNIVEVRRNGARFWGVHFIDRAGKRVGMNVPSESAAREVVALVKTSQAAQQGASAP